MTDISKGAVERHILWLQKQAYLPHTESFILALSARIAELEAASAWNYDIESAPKGVPVIVHGGLAMKKTGGVWVTGMEEPLYQRELGWDPECWMHLPRPNNTAQEGK